MYTSAALFWCWPPQAQLQDTEIPTSVTPSCSCPSETGYVQEEEEEEEDGGGRGRRERMKEEGRGKEWRRKEDRWRRMEEHG